MRLYLVRHGETVWNAEQRIQGHCDVDLSEAGQIQGRAIMRRLRQEHIDAAYSSDLCRAWETAEIIVGPHEIPVIRSGLLREAMLGAWQGHTAEELAERYPESYAKYKADSVVNRPPGAERLEDVIARCGEYLSDILLKNPEDNVLIVGHGGSIRGIICAVFGLPPQFYRRIRLDNAGLTIIDIVDADRPVLVCLNDTCHLRDSGAVDEWTED